MPLRKRKMMPDLERICENCRHLHTVNDDQDNYCVENECFVSESDTCNGWEGDS